MRASITVRGHAGPLFQRGKRDLDGVSGFVPALAAFDCFFSTFPWRNTGCDLWFRSYRADQFAVASAISDQGFGLG